MYFLVTSSFTWEKFSFVLEEYGEFERLDLLGFIVDFILSNFFTIR